MKIKRISPRKTILGAFVVASLISMSGCAAADNLMRNLQGKQQSRSVTATPQESGTNTESAPEEKQLSAQDVLEMSQKNFEELASYRMNIYSQSTQDFKISLAKSGKDNSVMHFSVNTPNVKAIELYIESVYDQPQMIYLNAVGFWVKLEPAEFSKQAQDLPFSPDTLNPLNEYFKYLSTLSKDNFDLNIDETVSGISNVMGVHVKDKNNNPSIIYISKDTMLPVRIITNADTVANVSEIEIKGDVIIDIYDFNKVESIVVPEEAKNASGINNIANNVLNKLGSGAQDLKGKFGELMGK